jgi:hypothetical protein
VADWTAKEMQFIQAGMGLLPVRAMAAHLGRSIGAVKGVSHRLRRKRSAEGRPLPRLPAQVYRTIERHGPRIRAMNQAGHSDPAIAFALGVDRRRVAAARRMLGLPARRNGLGARSSRAHILASRGSL